VGVDPDRALPEALEAVIQTVLHNAGLDFVDGREEVERELRAHFEDGVSAGMSAEDLVRRFGDPLEAGRHIAKTRPRAAARRRGEQGRWWMSLKEWWGEVRFAARRLGRAPGFATIVVLTLGLGVGANTAIFTVVNAVVLEDMPYSDPDRLVRVYQASAENATGFEFMPAPLVAEYRTWDQVFDGFGALYTYREVGGDLTDGDVPRRITMTRVSAGYFKTLGVAPQRGRTFEAEESFGPGEAGSSATPIARVAIVSDDLWRHQFGGRLDLIGSTIEVDGDAWEVVGIMPAGFRNPFGSRSDLWVPQDLRPGGSNTLNNYYLSGVARLRDGVTLEAAQERVRTLATGYAEAQPDAEGMFPRLVPLHADVVGSTRQTMLWILAAAAGLVLLTACVNVANLLFARGLSRDRDLAVRSALGSGRARLVTGILTENGLLAIAGGLLGLALGWGGVRTLLRLAPAALPTSVDVVVGGPVFLFALAITVLALIVFGLTPALRLSRTAPAEVLRSGDRAASAGKLARRLGDGLIVLQVAAALSLVAGATLLTRSFDSLRSVDLGVDWHGVLTYEVHLPRARYADGAARETFHERLETRVAALPGVQSVGATSWLPVHGRYHTWGFYWDPEHPDGTNDDAWYGTDVRIIAGDYFESLGIDLLQGDPPSGVDLQAEDMVWVNRTLMDEVLEGVDPVGQTIWVAGAARRIMGIVEDTPYDTRGATSRKVYVPHAQYADNRNWALIQTVRAQGDLTDLRDGIRSALAELDPELVMYRPRSFESVLDEARAQDRFATVLMGALAGLALLLSLLGTYGMLAGSVTSRRREIGIRMALGADRRRVGRMVLAYAARLTVPGVLLGLVVAWIGSRWIEALLFGIDVADPISYAAAVTVFLVAGLLSALLPALRATRVDTVQTLAAE
jgi:putative ABC transport system permease protein